MLRPQQGLPLARSVWSVLCRHSGIAGAGSAPVEGCSAGAAAAQQLAERRASAAQASSRSSSTLAPQAQQQPQQQQQKQQQPPAHLREQQPHVFGQPSPPWTPTRLLEKRKTYQKRMRHLITELEREYAEGAAAARAPVPDFRAGDVLEVTVVVPEADRKAVTYKGVCIARSNKGPRSWFKIYNVFPDAGGFVQHFPLFMPDILSIKVAGRVPRARRARLYHLLQDESGAHTYQADVAPAAAPPAAAAGK